jgi:hypothetical protein
MLIDTSRAKGVGFRSRFGLADGIDEAVAWWQATARARAHA